jgi:hypothetical protein
MEKLDALIGSYLEDRLLAPDRAACAARRSIRYVLIPCRASSISSRPENHNHSI